MFPKRHKRALELARRVAFRSTYCRQRHGAVLIKGGTVRNVSTNSINYCSFAGRFRPHDMCGHATQHAEVGAVLGLDRSVTEGSIVYVVRINKSGDLLLSKPCPMCECILRHCGVKKVIYSVSDKEIGEHRI